MRFLLSVILSGSLLLGAPQAQAQRAAGFAAGARSSTASNTMLDDVVGNRHSPLKTQTKATGITYRITPDGTIIGPDGQVVTEGCTLHEHIEARRKDHDVQPPTGKDFEKVTIGFGAYPAQAHSHEKPGVILNASFGPPDLYVAPAPCKREAHRNSTLTMDAASSLAVVDGNVFALAGNHSTTIEANQSFLLPDGDVQLTSRDEAAQP